MKYRGRTSLNLSKGITLVELMITIAVIAILTAIAVPSLSTWSRNLELKKTAREVVAMLRNAKSEAISKNREHRMLIVQGTGRYGYSSGNTAYCGTSCAWGAVTNWKTVSTPVTFGSSTTIYFTPNGAALTDVNIAIRDDSGATRYTVGVTSSGHISVTP